jgi:hypothetical protein
MGHTNKKRDKKTDITPFEQDNIECDTEVDDLIKSMEDKGEQAQLF